MYKIYADDVLIYDSTLDDYRIGKGTITKEAGKSGSFVFSLYPDHPAYNDIVRMRTVVTVYKFNRIVFRGRVLNDVTDYWNTKELTCEGELGFLQDSIIRPYTFTGSVADLFAQLVTQHNAQVDEFKRFKVGKVTVSGSTTMAQEGYVTAAENINAALVDTLGGYLHVTHDDEGQTLHYLADFTDTATQSIEFGSNLKNYTKTVKAEEMATAIIPLGAPVETTVADPTTGSVTTVTGDKLTIKDVNDGKDYVYSKEGVALYGWIAKMVEWSDVTDAANLKAKAEAYLQTVVNQAVTIELNAIDLHLLDRSIESFNVCEYVRVVSAPHGFAATMLCNKQTLDLLKPENDTVTLGQTYATFTEKNTKALNSVARLASLQSSAIQLTNTLTALTNATGQNSADIVEIIARLDALEGGGEPDDGTGDETDDPTIV